MCKNPSPSYKASPDTWCRWTHPKLTPWSQIYLPKRMENKHTCVIGYNWDSAPIHSQPGQSNQTTSSNNTNKTTTRHKTVIMKSLLLETWLIIIIFFFTLGTPFPRGPKNQLRNTKVGTIVSPGSQRPANCRATKQHWSAIWSVIIIIIFF